MMRDPDERERILVVRFSSLGDILLTAPTLRALRKRFERAEISLLVATEYADAASLIPGPDQVLVFDRRTGLPGLRKLRAQLSRQFSVFVDLQNSVRSAFLRHSTFPLVWTKARRYRSQRWLLVHFKWNLYGETIPVPLRYLQAVKVLGAEDDQQRLELLVPESTRSAAAKIIEPVVNRPLVGICPGARHFTKRWPAEGWSELVRRLESEGYATIVFGDHSESELVNGIVSTAGAGIPVIGCTIPEVAGIMERCDAVISNDSGLMHLAAGVGTPIVAIFGPTVKEFGFFPFRAISEVMEQPLDCRPCSAMGTEVCRERHFRCMRDTTPPMVLDAFHRVREAVKQRA